MGILRQMENGMPVSELCREHGMSSATVYKWRAKSGGMDADVSMQNGLLKEAFGKNETASSTPGVGRESGDDKGCQHYAGLPVIWRQRNMLSYCQIWCPSAPHAAA